MIATERESKKALQKEKQKLEKTIVSMKRDPKAVGGHLSNRGDEVSSRHNESMSMYFAHSQMMFSPRIKADNSAKSFVTKGSRTSRPQVFQSQTIDRNQLYLSKQFSGDPTSSVGGGSL